MSHLGTTCVCALCGLECRNRGRGLCTRCYEACRYDGTLIAYPTRKRPLTEVIEDWQDLAATGVPRKDIAPRLGMTRTALDRAIQRGRQMGLLERPQ